MFSTLMTLESKQFRKQVSRFAIPVMAQDIIANIILIAVSILVSKVDEQAVSAVGIATQLYFLFYMFSFGITTSSGVYIAQFWGKGDVPSIHKTMGLTVIVGLSFATIFAIIGIFFPEHFMTLFSNKNPAVVALGSTYLRIVSFSFFIMAINETLKYALRSIGQAKIPLFSTTVNVITHFCLTFLFTRVFNYGVAGAAYALVIARFADMLVQLSVTIYFKLPIATKFTNYFGAKKDFIVEYSKIALPVVTNEVFWAVGTVFYTKCYSYTGTEGQLAFQIANPIISLFNVFGNSIGIAGGIMVSNSLGAGKIDVAREYAKKTIKYVAAMSVLVGIVLAVSSPLILSFYKISSLDNVLVLTHKILLVASFMVVFKCVNYTIIIAVLRSGGDTLFCLLTDTVSVLCVGLPLAFITSKYLHQPIYIVTLAACMEEVIKIILCMFRLKHDKWAKNLVADL